MTTLVFVCTVLTALSPFAKSFELRDLETQAPRSTLYDASLLDPPERNARGELVLRFSNECDNFYEVRIDPAYPSGAEFTYFDSYLADATWPEDRAVEHDLKMTCRVERRPK